MAHDDSLTIPHGYQLTTTTPHPVPTLSRSVGGAWVAHLGIEGDEQRAEVEQLFRHVMEALREVQKPVWLAAGAGAISALFEPKRPAVRRVSSVLVWTGMDGCFSGFVESSEGVQQLLRLFHGVASMPQSPMQVLFLTNSWEPNTVPVLARLLGLGIFVRSPDPRGGVVLLEVTRPDGVVTALPGAAIAIQSDGSTREFNRHVDLALARGDQDRVAELVRQERAELAKVLVPIPADSGERPYGAFPNSYARRPGKPVFRCGRLHVLTLNALREPEALALVVELAAALLASPYPLLALTDRSGRNMVPVQLGSGPIALAVFPDVLTLERVARDSPGEPVGGFIECSIIDICQRALANGFQLALGTLVANRYRYMLFANATVRALAAGQVPTLMALKAT
jgi:hypothetical protein